VEARVTRDFVMQERIENSNIVCAPKGIASFETVGVTELGNIGERCAAVVDHGAQRQTRTIRNANVSRESKRMKARGGQE